MKKYFLQSIYIVSIAAIVIANPTLANDRAVDLKANQIHLAQQSKTETEVETKIRQLTEQWIDGWSPGEEPFDVSKLQLRYAQGDNAILVYDDIGEEVAVIRSWDEYAETWQPFMQQFAYWSIQPEGEIEVTATENMAVSNFVWVGEARYQDGREIMPKQYATLVWQKQNGNWVIVREHLTAAKN